MQRMQLGLSLVLLTVGVGGTSQGVTPIRRVVDLLQGLQTKLEQDFEAEKSLFEKYECWYKTIVDSKTTSNSAAQSRMDSLTGYIKDIEAGKFEFTTERVDLEKQISTLQEDLKVAKSLRDKEGQDYVAAKEEMDKAVAALDKAIKALEAGAPSSLLAKAWGQRRSLEEALSLGRSLLAASDAQFLERLAAGEVPQKDWKKLNRKATFKMKYGTQTGRIVKTLKALKVTFEQNLVEAKAKEDGSQASYNKLKGSKDTMLSTSQTSLVDMIAETGARELTKSEAQTEVDALDAQIKADTKFVSETQTAFDQKKIEWGDREKIRRTEISAISEAIAVLHSDEARDVFKTSYKSQGYLFLQASQETGRLSDAARLSSAVRSLRALASGSGDMRLSLLATVASMGTKTIATVIVQIDALVAKLKAEETSDLSTKESCETQRSEKVRQAKVQSVAFDDLTGDIGRAQEKVAELEAQMKEEEEKKVDLNEALKGMDRQRTDENTQYLADKADDEKAVQLIGQAEAVMTKLNADLMAGLAVKSKVHVAGSTQEVSEKTSSHSANLAAVKVDVHAHTGIAAGAAHSTVFAAQQSSVVASRHSGRAVAVHGQPFEVSAGEAPPPPPTTWAEPAYKGSTSEHKGINAILALIKADIQADVQAADKAEKDALDEYTKQKGDLELAVKAADDTISGYTSAKATQDQAVVDKTSDRDSKKDELVATMAEIKALEPGCDFVLVNYDVRRTNRQTEIDGLTKAKAILQGAKFA